MSAEVTRLATTFSVEVDPEEDSSIIALKVFEEAMGHIADEKERHKMAIVNAKWIKAYHESKLQQLP